MVAWMAAAPSVVSRKAARTAAGDVAAGRAGSARSSRERGRSARSRPGSRGGAGASRPGTRTRSASAGWRTRRRAGPTSARRPRPASPAGPGRRARSSAIALGVVGPLERRRSAGERLAELVEAGPTSRDARPTRRARARRSTSPRSASANGSGSRSRARGRGRRARRPMRAQHRAQRDTAGSPRPISRRCRSSISTIRRHCGVHVDLGERDEDRRTGVDGAAPGTPARARSARPTRR